MQKYNYCWTERLQIEGHLWVCPVVKRISSHNLYIPYKLNQVGK